MGTSGGRVESISELPLDKQNSAYINSSKRNVLCEINNNNNRIEHSVVQKDRILVSIYKFMVF
jgi:hypothetical protein